MRLKVIGRAADQAAIQNFIARARSAASALIIEGEAGIGKTTLWNAAVRSAQDQGFAVLVARPASAEADMPLGAFADLFGAVPDDVLLALPSPQRHALEVALLRSDATTAPLDQRAVSFATTNLLHALTDRAGPVLLAVDDVCRGGSRSPTSWSSARTRVAGSTTVTSRTSSAGTQTVR
jgi:predicted ATPase